MVVIVWTEFALEDLESIHDYISRDSKIYASRQVERIINRVDQLIKFPKAGRVVPEFNSELLLELIEGNYRIIYHISTDSLTVGIVRIHHAARQLK